MTIEQIEAELARLKPEEEAAWNKRAEAKAKLSEFEVSWYPLQRRVAELEAALKILKESKPTMPEQEAK